MTRLCILSLLRVDIETEWNLKDGLVEVIFSTV